MFFELTIFGLLVSSIFLAISPLRLILSSVSLLSYMPLANISANAPLFIFPIIIALSLLLNLHKDPRISMESILKSFSLPLFFLGILLIFLEHFNKLDGSVTTNFRYGLACIWGGFSILTFEMVGRIAPTFRIFVLRFILCMCLLTALSLLVIYVFYSDRVYEYYAAFSDTPLGLIHQESFLMTLGTLIVLYSPIPELRRTGVKAGMAILFTSVILANFSRGALVTQFALFTPILLRHLKVSIAGAALVVLTIFINPSLSNKVKYYSGHLSLNFTQLLEGEVKTGKDMSANIRINSSKKALEGFYSSPFTGVGSENIPRFYSVISDNEVLTHTYWMIILAGYGLVGFFALLMATCSTAINIGRFDIGVAFVMMTGGILTFLPYFEDWFFLTFVSIAFSKNVTTSDEKNTIR